MLVYRRGGTWTAAEDLRRELMERIAHASQGDDHALAALLRAGELETALADAAHSEAPQAAGLTDALADACLSRETACDLRPWLAWLERAELPGRLCLRRPEGYAYYNLDPRSYAEHGRRLARPGDMLTVIGVRSIGTSLSAVVLAAAKARGARAWRLTVRPTGNPNQRTLAFSAEQRALVDARRGGLFAVADEGPGLSGSTFLSVGEALHEAGVAFDRITFLCSHAVDPVQLQAFEAERRWRRFRVCWPRFPEVTDDLSAGRWRALLFARPSQWPACWAQRERCKRLSPDGTHLLKFIGLPPYGDLPLYRAQQLADAGFSPQVCHREAGILRQPWHPGRRASPKDAAMALPRIADYLAFRWRECRSEATSPDLENMMRINALEALGQELSPNLRLVCEHPVHSDGRMAPHEWLFDKHGTLLKTDAFEHGDDHLFPGPCDIAWDIAGTIVEWSLDTAQTQALLRLYERRTHDRVQPRLHPYLIAYTSLQLGCMQLALLSCEPDERDRLTRAARSYRSSLCGFVRQSNLHAAAPEATSKLQLQAALPKDGKDDGGG